MFTPADEHFMHAAIQLAKKAHALGEVPVGALLTLNDRIIAEGFNQPIKHHDPTAHAEVIALRQAGSILGNYRLVGTTLYVTLEPCMMCVGAMVHARISRLVYGAFDPKAGAVVSQITLSTATFLNHQLNCAGGLMASECGQLLSEFFKARREEKREDRIS